MRGFFAAIVLALLFAMSQPWITQADTCPCPSKCQCPLPDCLCGSLAHCVNTCPCDVMFVQAVAPVVETKACDADDSGTAFFKDGKQCGWLCHAEMKYYPMLPSGNFGPSCAIPKGATTVKPVATPLPTLSSTFYDAPFGTSAGGCANGSCGGSASAGRAGLFGRRH